jgi:hypothetical protein
MIVLATVSVLLVAVYLYWVSFYVLFPADILIWSESDFINDILKFRVGYPLYSAQQNNESFVYAQGSRLVTYFLAWVSGHPLSIPTYRAIQVFFTLLAAIMATFSFFTLVKASSSHEALSPHSSWGILALPVLFLLASNSITNPFVHNLHDDALAQLVSISAYYLLLRYNVDRSSRLLALMAVVPAVGFLVKQSLAIWAVFYCAYLFLFDRPRSFARIIGFAVSTAAALVFAVTGGYLLWGEDFVYWIFTVLASHPVSPLRSFQHLVDGWAYFVIGLLGGLTLLRGEEFSRLLGLWLVWLLLLLIESYTSGVAWMRNHMGPGSLIAGIWFLAGMAKYFSASLPVQRWQPESCLRTGMIVFAVVLLFNGLGVIRIPSRPDSADTYRYVREIEKEFNGGSLEKVLLDVGTWVYLNRGVVMKDRAPSIGERGYSETGDFSGILRRIEDRHYAKILVRNLHSFDFWYDYHLWRRPSGIREALLENYKETGRIMAARSNGSAQDPYLFSEISILTPKSNYR